MAPECQAHPRPSKKKTNKYNHVIPLLKTNPVASSFFQDKKSKNPSHDPSDLASNPSGNQLALPSKTIQKMTTSYHLQFNHLATTIFSPLGFLQEPVHVFLHPASQPHSTSPSGLNPSMVPILPRAKSKAFPWPTGPTSLAFHGL